MKDILTFSAATWDIELSETDLNDGYPFLSWQAGDSSPAWYIYDVSVVSSPGSSSSGGSPVAPTCTAAVLQGAPDLFQIDTDAKHAILYFAPVPESTNYMVSYGYTESDDRFGVMTNDSDDSGVQVYTVNHLEPNTTYYFRVRGQNDCMPGNWGNTMKITTPQTGAKTYYKNLLTQILSVLPR